MFFEHLHSSIQKVSNNLLYMVIQEERLVLWEVTLPDIVRKNMFI
jgi:hypothetical protein